MTEKIPLAPALAREFVSDLEVRAAGEGRTIAGIVVPFGAVARVSDGGPAYEESFRLGSFAKTIAERGEKVKLLSQHMAQRNPLGRATLLREDAAGLYGEFYVSKTAAGDEALALARDGALDSFSVGFSPVKAVKENGVTVRTEVHLREASLVTFPAYADATVTAVRALTDDDLADIARRVAALNASTVTPGEPTVADTSLEAVLSGTEPLPQHSVRNLHLALRAQAREKGAI